MVFGRSLAEQSLHRLAQPSPNPRGLARQPVDKDMHKVTDRRRRLIALLEDADLVAHAGVAQFADAQASINHIGKANRLEELAMRLDREADLLAAAEVQPAGFHQITVDDRIEELVVDDVVDMVVDIVVAPTRGDWAAVSIMLAPFIFGVQCRRTYCLAGDMVYRPYKSVYEAHSFKSSAQELMQ